MHKVNKSKKAHRWKNGKNNAKKARRQKRR